MNLHTNLDLTQNPEKFRKKVAENAEIPKTAPLTQPKNWKKSKKSS